MALLEVTAGPASGSSGKGVGVAEVWPKAATHGASAARRIAKRPCDFIIV
jgi:hypothetical protein